MISLGHISKVHLVVYLSLSTRSWTKDAAERARDLEEGPASVKEEVGYRTEHSSCFVSQGDRPRRDLAALTLVDSCWIGRREIKGGGDECFFCLRVDVWLHASERKGVGVGVGAEDGMAMVLRECEPVLQR